MNPRGVARDSSNTLRGKKFGREPRTCTRKRGSSNRLFRMQPISNDEWRHDFMSRRCRRSALAPAG